MRFRSRHCAVDFLLVPLFLAGKAPVMDDAIERLRMSSALRALLSHYALAADPTVWLDRLMQFASASAQDMVALHGELLAHQWLEQNTGIIVKVTPGAVPGCYRATRAGYKALTAASRPRDDEECAGNGDTA
jgi:hypothetical protein